MSRLYTALKLHLNGLLDINKDKNSVVMFDFCWYKININRLYQHESININKDNPLIFSWDSLLQLSKLVVAHFFMFFVFTKYFACAVAPFAASSLTRSATFLRLVYVVSWAPRNSERKQILEHKMRSDEEKETEMMKTKTADTKFGRLRSDLKTVWPWRS